MHVLFLDLIDEISLESGILLTGTVQVCMYTYTSANTNHSLSIKNPAPPILKIPWTFEQHCTVCQIV